MVVHPGVSDTGLFNEMSWIQVVLMKILAPFLTHSIEKAAVPSIYAALSVNVKSGDFLGPTGFYGMKGKLGLAQRSEYAKDEAIASDLWDLSEQLCGIKFTL